MAEATASSSSRASSSQDSSSWVTWAVIGTCGTVAVAGLGYLAWSFWSSGDDDNAVSSSTPSRKDVEGAARLKIARTLQMQMLASAPRRTAPPPANRAAPSLPARVSPPGISSAPAAAGPSKPAAKAGPSLGSSSGSRKTCAQCTKPLNNGLPLRCSSCKVVYYCSQDCQRKAWPEHKAACKAQSKGSATPASTTPAESVSSPQAVNSDSASPVVSDASPSVAREEHAEPSATAPASIDSTATTTAPDAGGEQKEPQSFQEALAMYLEQNAASKTDQLEASFEMAVMLFVKGEYRAAITQLNRVQELAQERGDAGVQGEVYKWLGHAHNRLADIPAAERQFKQGLEYATAHNLGRLEIDCLAGLGVMYRAQGDTPQAVSMLERALSLCEQRGDVDSRASTLCNLGAALMPVDPDKGLAHLHEAVNLREDAIERLHDQGERSGLATAVMEHANALVNLASALLLTRRLPEAEACYVRALEVFELVEDVDKAVKVLLNLANMKEIQVGTPAARAQALEYRLRLLKFLEGHGVRRVDTACAICLDPITMTEVTGSDDQELILLSCLHCLHNKCWERWVEQHRAGVACPTCKQPVPVFAVDS